MDRSKLELLDPWEVLFDDISLHTIIGEGEFGKVYRGELLKELTEVGKRRKCLQRKTYRKQQQTSKGLTVAVKMLQSKSCFCHLLKTYKYNCILAFFFSPLQRFLTCSRAGAGEQ